MLTGRRRAIHRDLGSIPLHPLLAAAYPVVFLFATNAADQVTLAPLWLPLAITVAGSGAVLVGLWLLTRDWLRAGLLTTVLVVAFFGYGHAWNAVSGGLASQWPLIGVWVLVAALALFLAWRARRRARVLTQALNLVTAILLVLNVWGLGTSMIALGAAGNSIGDISPIDLEPPDPNDLPDVYYIIPDRYAGVTALADVYGFDNEPFLRALEDRGFSVARHAHANYVKTALSVTSSLNMAYLDGDLLNEEATSPSDTGPIHRRLQEHHAVPAALKALGYLYVQLGNWWTPTQTNVDADRTFLYEGQDEFSSALLQTTFVRALGEPHAAPDDPWDWVNMRQGNLYALQTLEELATMPGPKYVFAHLVTTHPPYVHDTDGSFTGRQVVAERGDAESYIRQLQYANTRLLGIVDRIIAADPDAVILLQADEGPFPARYAANGWDFRWEDATDEELEEKFGILSAMRVPGADLEAAGWHDALTPVNAFRIIFNARFGTDLELLPERTYAHTDLHHHYDFIEITDRLGLAND
jgi:hypothetical protein